MKSLGQAELLDLIVQPANGDVVMEDAEDSRPSKRKVMYNEVHSELKLKNLAT